MIELDELVRHALYAGPHAGAAATLAVIASMLGSGWALVLLAPALALRAHRAWAARLLAAVVVTAALVASLKSLTARPLLFRVVPGAPALGDEAPRDGLFPSGHAAGAFACAAFLATLDCRARAPALAWAAAVAASRVALGVHWPSDVVAGAMLGAAVGALAPRVAPLQLPPTQTPKPGG